MVQPIDNATDTPLNPLYYLDNFTVVLGWVAERYDDLLDVDERALITGFAELPVPSRALLARMVMRKGDLFRSSALRYPEIGDAVVAMQALHAQGWVEHDPELSLEQLYGLLTRSEFAAALQLNAPKGALKSTLYTLAQQRHPSPQPFSLWCPESGEHLYALQIREVCDRIRLMFFGNLHQDWSEFVLAHLGIYQYEKIAFSADSRAFLQRADIDDYLYIHRCRDQFYDTSQDDSRESELARLGAVEDRLMALTTSNPWLQNKRAKLLFNVAQRLEQLADYPAALRNYAECHYPGARLRQIRVLEKSGQSATALQLANIAVSAPEGAAELQGLQRMLPRLQRAAGYPATTLRRLREPASLHWVLPAPAAGAYVEQVARDHYAATDPSARVFYVENTLINSLFGLLCWDVIFLALPGAFFHPFQSRPADLHRSDFFSRRRTQFQQCLDQLHNDQWRSTIRHTYARKRGLQSPFVFWESLDPELLELALDCIPPAHLLRWFERLLEDIAAHRNGFPDLIVFWPAERRYQMIEIKGPGDRLQDNQRRLIDFALTHDIPLSVCYISWQEP